MGPVEAETEHAGLRERKKQRTRETIARVALELFAEHGYAETTLAQIAAAADVSPRTVSAYFPAKEQLVFADADTFFASLEQRLGARQAGETAADALRAWLTDYLADDTAKDAQQRRCVHELVDADPTLEAYDRRLHGQAADIIARAVAVDLGLEPEALLPRMVGAATMAALDTLGRHAKDGSREVADREAQALIDDTMAFVGAGVRELAQRRPG